MTFSISTEPSGVACVAICGRLDGLAASRLRNELERLVTRRRPQILIDLSSVRLIDTAGVDLLLATLKACESHSGVLVLAGLRGQPRATLKLMQLDRLFTSNELDLTR